MTTLHQIAQTIKDIKIAMLTTLNADGTLHSRPMATQNIIPSEFDGRLWFFTQKESLKVNEIQNDTHVNLGYAAPEKNHYVSISGKANISQDRECIKELWTPALEAWFDGPEDPEIAVITVEVQDAQVWDGPPSKIAQIYEMARSFFNGKSVDKKGSLQSIHLEDTQNHVMTEDEKLDEALRESFPASDSPGYHSKSSIDRNLHQ